MTFSELPNRNNTGIVDYGWTKRRRRFVLFVRVFIYASVILFCAGILSAQTKILYYDFHAKSGQPVPEKCLAAGEVFTQQLARFPHPAKWTYIIACDDMAWTEMIHTARNEYGALIFGATNPDNSTTLLRGTTLRGEGDKRMTAEHLVAHELSHIFLHSYDERKVDALAQEWLQGRSSLQLASAGPPQ